MSISSKRTRFAVKVDKYAESEVSSLEQSSGAIFLDTTNNVLSYFDNTNTVRNLESVNLTGWGSYNDTEHTSGSTQSLTASTDNVLANNAGSNTETYLPSDISALYQDGVNPRILSNNVGDAYEIRISFTASISNVSGYASLKFDIGDGITPVIISDRIFTFPKGTGVFHNFSLTSATFSLDTYVANGLRILVNPSHTMQVYGVNYLIIRTHRAV